MNTYGSAYRMKMLIINKSDTLGGAAVVSFRLMEALRRAGADARMLVVDKQSRSPYVETAAGSAAIRSVFLRERLSIFLANGMNRDTLFRIDTATAGLPLHRHPRVLEADVICLNWVNQGMLSLAEIRRIGALGKPIVWTMHDMWNMTGVCHHAGECRRWQLRCGHCPLLGRRASDSDISFHTWVRKSDLYAGTRIAFVAVSNWLAGLARKSLLMRDADISVIHNAFPFDNSGIAPRKHQGIRILFGAARIDDPVKGLPVMKRATQIFAADYPDKAAACELVTFGGVRDPEALADFGISHRHLGMLAAPDVRALYEDSDMVVSTSHYETLPGTIIEGQAWGCVPVSLDRGGQADIIDHLQTGYLAHWSEDGGHEKGARAIAEGMAWAYDELQRDADGLRRRMLAEARRRFDAQTIASQYLELFRRLGVAE